MTESIADLEDVMLDVIALLLVGHVLEDQLRPLLFVLKSVGMELLQFPNLAMTAI